jgi:hypothetical protein
MIFDGRTVMLQDHVVVNYSVKFSGTPEQVRQWIIDNDPEFLNKIHDVMIGGTSEYVSIKHYLDMDTKKIA